MFYYWKLALIIVKVEVNRDVTRIIIGNSGSNLGVGEDYQPFILSRLVPLYRQYTNSYVHMSTKAELIPAPYR